MTSGDVLGNDSELDKDTLTVTVVDGVAIGAGAVLIGAFGSLIMQREGTYTYFADHAEGLISGQVATDTFTYQVSDGSLADDATLTFTISGQDEVVTPPPPPQPRSSRARQAMTQSSAPLVTIR